MPLFWISFALFFLLKHLKLNALDEEICQNEKQILKCNDNEFLFVKKAHFGIFPTSKCRQTSFISNQCTQNLTEKIYKSCTKSSCEIDVVDGPLFESKDLDSKCNNSVNYSLQILYECINSKRFIKLSDFYIDSDVHEGYILSEDHFHNPSELKEFGRALCSKYPIRKTFDFQEKTNLLLRIRTFKYLDFNQNSCLIGEKCSENFLSIDVVQEGSSSPKNILKICSHGSTNGREFNSQEVDEENFVTIDLISDVTSIKINYNFDIESSDNQVWSKGPFMKYMIIKCPLLPIMNQGFIEYDFESIKESLTTVYAKINCPIDHVLKPYESIDYETLPDDFRLSHNSFKVYCNQMTRQWSDFPSTYQPECLNSSQVVSLIESLQPETTTTSTTTNAPVILLPPSSLKPTDDMNSIDSTLENILSESNTNSTEYQDESFLETFRKSPLLISVAIALGFILCFITLIICLCLFRRRISARIQRKIALDANAGRLNQTRNFLLRSFGNSFGTYKFDTDNMMYKSDYSNNTANYFEMDKSKLIMTPGNSTPYLMNSGTIPVRGYMINDNNPGTESIPNYMPTIGSTRIGRVTWKGSYQQVPILNTPTFSPRYNAILPSCPQGTMSMAELSRKRSQFSAYQENTNPIYNINQFANLNPITSNTIFNRIGNTHATDKFGSEGHLANVGNQPYNDPGNGFVISPNPQQNLQNSSDLMLNDTEELPLKQSEQVKMNQNCHRISSLIRSKWANVGFNNNNSVIMNNSDKQNLKSSRSSLAFTGSIRNQAFNGCFIDEDKSLSDADKIKDAQTDEDGDNNASATYLTPKDFNLETLKNANFYTTYIPQTTRNKDQNRPLSDAMLSNHYYLSGVQDPGCVVDEKHFSYSCEDYKSEKSPETEDVYESVEDHTPINLPNKE